MSKIKIPQKLPCLFVTDGIIFPGSSHKIPCRSSVNISMIEECLIDLSASRSQVICILYKDENAKVRSTKSLNGVHEMGTAAMVTQVVGTNWPRPSYTLQVVGLCRVKIEEILQNHPFSIVLTRLAGETVNIDEFERQPFAVSFRSNLTKFLSVVPSSSVAIAKLKRVLTSGQLDNVVDLTASVVDGSFEEKRQILNSVDLKIRTELVDTLLKKHTDKLEKLTDDRQEFTVDLNPDTFSSDEFSKSLMNLWNRRRAIDSRSNVPTLKSSRDDDGENPNELGSLAQKLKDAKMPAEVDKVVMQDFKKLKSTMPMMPEYSMLRSYLELIADLPWSKETKDTLDVIKAKKDLDDDHYGLEDVKKRILEYLAVRRLKNSLKGPILCFVGPPGVGKTSVGRSVARTLGRNFHRISLGGVCDQSDIRGHRRTYIGAMPGRIVNGLKTAQSRNPVFLLDEIDKMSAGIHGDPTAALLEVLDPEQNSTFVDHYLNVPFDLSQVLFIATANSVQGIPAALLDRMELVQISGYTLEEKIRIGQKYLLPKQMNEHGLSTDHISLPEKSLREIAHKYTREAGVRNFERKIGAVMRAVALKFAEKHETSSDAVEPNANSFQDSPIVVDDQALSDILGAPIYAHESRNMLALPGVVAGLAWTQVGGEVMYVETSKMGGEGKLTLTGQLGDIMQESVRIALTWLRTHAEALGITSMSSEFLDKVDLHVHFPAGAVSKDGPSAGVAVVSALVSLFLNKAVRTDTAVTGEITLRGLVLPVGGIKEKVLAASRAGFTRVILPKKNERDTSTLPTEIKETLKIVFVDTIEEALIAAFDDEFVKLSQFKLQSKI